MAKLPNWKAYRTSNRWRHDRVHTLIEQPELNCDLHPCLVFRSRAIGPKPGREICNLRVLKSKSYHLTLVCLLPKIEMWLGQNVRGDFFFASAWRRAIQIQGHHIMGYLHRILKWRGTLMIRHSMHEIWANEVRTFQTSRLHAWAVQICILIFGFWGDLPPICKGFDFNSEKNHLHTITIWEI